MELQKRTLPVDSILRDESRPLPDRVRHMVALLRENADVLGPVPLEFVLEIIEDAAHHEDWRTFRWNMGYIYALGDARNIHFG